MKINYVIACLLVIISGMYALSSTYYVQENVSINAAKFDNFTYSYACTKKGDKTLNSSICNYTVEQKNGTIRSSAMQWREMKDVSIDARSCIDVLHVTGDTIRYGQKPIDIIPALNFSAYPLQKSALRTAKTSDIFSKLKSVDQDLTEHKMLYEVCNPTNYKMALPKIKSYYVEKKSEIKETKDEFIQKDWTFFNESWGKRRKITITNNAGKSEDDYTHKLYIKYNDSMQADFDDLRFTDLSNNILNHYIERNQTVNSDYATVYVNTSNNYTLGASYIWLYYNNTDAVDVSNYDKTFFFFDHFDTPNNQLNTSRWRNIFGDHCGVSNSILTIEGDGSGFGGDCALETNETANALFGVNYTMEYYAKSLDVGGVNDYMIDVGFQSYGVSYGEYAIIQIDDCANDGDIDLGSGTSGSWSEDADGLDSTYAELSNFSIWEIWRNDTQLNYNISNSVATKSDYVPTKDLRISARGHKREGVYWDWVAVYKKHSPSPSYTFGDEEEAVILNTSLILETPINATLSEFEVTINYTMYSDNPDIVIDNCSIRFNISDSVYSNESKIIINETVSRQFIFNASYNKQQINYSVTCYHDLDTENESSYFIFNKNVANVSGLYQYNINVDWGDVPSYYYCVNNTHLRAEWDLTINGTQWTQHKLTRCQYGCNDNQCNAEESLVLYFALPIGALLIVLISKYMYGGG